MMTAAWIILGAAALLGGLAFSLFLAVKFLEAITKEVMKGLWK